MTMETGAQLLVRHVEPFSLGSESASVTLSSGQSEVIAFCWPCSVSEGSHVPNRLHVLDETLLRAAYLDDWPASQRELAETERLAPTGTYSYAGCGKVLDADRGLVFALGFVLDFGEIPAGCAYVEFEITRLDLR